MKVNTMSARSAVMSAKVMEEPVRHCHMHEKPSKLWPLGLGAPGCHTSHMPVVWNWGSL